MIRYALKCANDHSFDSWFGSSGDFDRLKAAGHVSCVICGTPDVSKALMAPRVVTAEDAATAPPPTDRPLSAPASPAEQALRALREKVESTCENVGRDFAAEARRIHAGDAPERGIFGEARLDEARALIEDGIAVAPLPWSGGRKT